MHAAVVAERKTQAQKENDLIYHALLPAEAGLPPIDKFDAAKPVPIQETYATADVAKLIGPDIFQRLVPLQVHEQASVYSEEKAKLARAEADAAEEADGDVAAGLASLGLPEGLNRFRGMLVGGQGGLEALAMPGKEALGWAGEINGQEREEETGALLAKLDQAKGTVEHDLDWIKDELDKESRECERLRVRALRSSFPSTCALVADAHMTPPPFPRLRPSMVRPGPSRPRPRSPKRTARTCATSRQPLRARRSRISASRPCTRRSGRRSPSCRRRRAWRRPSRRPSTAPRRAASRRTCSTSTSSRRRPRSRRSRTCACSLARSRSASAACTGSRRSGPTRSRSSRSSWVSSLCFLRSIRAPTTDTPCTTHSSQIQNDDVSQQLLLNRRTAPNGESSVFAAELEKFKPLRSRIATTVEHQQKTVEELGQRMDRLGRLSGAGKMLQGWEKAERAVGELTAQLESDIGEYREVRRALKCVLLASSSLPRRCLTLTRCRRSFLLRRRGLEFYAQLQGMTDSLRKTVKSFLSSREDERSRLVASAERSSGGSVSPAAFTNPYAAANPYASSQQPRASPTAAYPSPPPPPPAQPASNPYDFSALGGQLSAFSSSSPAPPPPQAPAAPSPYGSQAPYSSTYGGQSPYGAPSQPQQPLPPPQHQPSYPPPPPANPSPYPSYPAYQSSPSPYGAPSPPPLQQQQHSPYSALPPPPSQRQGSAPNPYGSYQPPPASPYGAAPSPYPPAPPPPPPGAGAQYSPYQQYR